LIAGKTGVAQSRLEQALRLRRPTEKLQDSPQMQPRLKIVGRDAQGSSEMQLSVSSQVTIEASVPAPQNVCGVGLIESRQESAERVVPFFGKRTKPPFIERSDNHQCSGVIDERPC